MLWKFCTRETMCMIFLRHGCVLSSPNETNLSAHAAYKVTVPLDGMIFRLLCWTPTVDTVHKLLYWTWPTGNKSLFSSKEAETNDGQGEMFRRSLMTSDEQLIWTTFFSLSLYISQYFLSLIRTCVVDYSPPQRLFGASCRGNNDTLLTSVPCDPHRFSKYHMRSTFWSFP